MTLAGELVRSVSGLPFEDYLRTRIFAPLGMTRSFSDQDSAARTAGLATGFSALQRDGSRVPVPRYEVRGLAAVAGIVSSVEDMARFAGWQLQGALGHESRLPALRPNGVPDSGLGNEQPGTEPPPFDQYPYRNPSSGISSSPDLRLFSDHGFGGSRLDVRAGTQWSDLTKAYIFWPFDDWNDEISSMQPTTSTALFKEHVDFKGSFLIAPKNVFVYNFGDYGWNDRISSVLNMG